VFGNPRILFENIFHYSFLRGKECLPAELTVAVALAASVAALEDVESTQTSRKPRLQPLSLVLHYQ
ncbi:hypothetical protein, partial [Salmonella sp. NW1079]|uniref:hypothetical protein n=1 Tax=Salmonella sp. NW1079 TaxID=2947519 RepID=UPI003F471B8F